MLCRIFNTRAAEAIELAGFKNLNAIKRELYKGRNSRESFRGIRGLSDDAFNSVVSKCGVSIKELDAVDYLESIGYKFTRRHDGKPMK